MVPEYLPSLYLFSSVVYYTWLWHNPKTWMRLVKPLDPALVMSKVSMVLRISQYLGGLSVATFSFSLYPPWIYLCCFALIVLGQAMNVKVYELLGVEGVYYGVRFGYHIPWVTSWPYTMVRDPQYIGSILTHIGVSVWLPWHYTVCGIMAYCIMINVESQVPGEKNKTGKK